jgi:hypothetical protein
VATFVTAVIVAAGYLVFRRSGDRIPFYL